MIRDIAEFIEKPLDDDMVNKIADKVSFKSMKTDPKLKIKHETLKGDFIRKGTVGDWIFQQVRSDSCRHLLLTEMSRFLMSKPKQQDQPTVQLICRQTRMI